MSDQPDHPADQHAPPHPADAGAFLLVMDRALDQWQKGLNLLREAAGYVRAGEPTGGLYGSVLEHLESTKLTVVQALRSAEDVDGLRRLRGAGNDPPIIPVLLDALRGVVASGTECCLFAGTLLDVVAGGGQAGLLLHQARRSVERLFDLSVRLWESARSLPRIRTGGTPPAPSVN